MSDNLLKQLKVYEQSGIYPFHMPGHKRRLAPVEMGGLYGMDLTEIDGFDNLHDAQGILKDAQDFAADLYHSEETAFIVNGSTAGILSAIAGICEDGGTILAARNCHQSVYHAIELHHLEPVYIYPPIHTKYGINEGIYPLDVDNMWISHPDIQAVVITSPTYDGVVSDIRSICHIAHAHGVPVIVDEAHGAHFCFSDYFPESAVACGADVVIQSTHKTLPALTQTALIHLNGPLIDRERIRRMLTFYQTSSPSYILMGSIDACLHMLKDRGGEWYEDYTVKLQRLRESIHRCRYIHMPELSDFCRDYTKDYDRSKLVLSVGQTPVKGKVLYDQLLHAYGLQMEMVSEDYVLAMTSVGDTADGYERLERALKRIDDQIGRQLEGAHEADDREASVLPQRLPAPEQRVSIYAARRQKAIRCGLDQSVGAVAMDYVYLYPPGVPLITPGEVITEAIVSVIRRWIAAGLSVKGIAADGETASIRIIADNNGSMNHMR